MDHNILMTEFESATPYELFRVSRWIQQKLDDPQTIKACRHNLFVDQRVEFYHDTEQRPILASILEIRRNRVRIVTMPDGKLYSVMVYMLKPLAGNETAEPQKPTGLNRNMLRVGDKVGYYDRQQHLQRGVVIRLNKKTATVRISSDEEWLVHYEFLQKQLDVAPGNPNNLSPLKRI